MQDVETERGDGRKPGPDTGHAADRVRGRGRGRPRGSQYPWRASMYLAHADGARVEAAADQLDATIPETLRQAVKAGLPLVLDKARKRKARKGSRVTP